MSRVPFFCLKCYKRHKSWKIWKFVSYISLKYFKGVLSGLGQFLSTESPLKMIKNAFYFTLKALFVLKISFVLTFRSYICSLLDGKNDSLLVAEIARCKNSLGTHFKFRSLLLVAEVDYRKTIFRYSL